MKSCPFLTSAVAAAVLAVCTIPALPANAAQNGQPELVSPTASASFNGLRANYIITRAEGGATVLDRFSGQSSRVIATFLKFSNLTVNLGAETVAAGIKADELDDLIDNFIAFFGRVPDADNLPYWIAQLRGGATVAQLASIFYGIAISADQGKLTGYSAGMSDRAFLLAFYKSALQQPSVNPAALDYWAAALANGTQTRASVVGAIIKDVRRYKGDPVYGHWSKLLDNRLQVAKKFALTEGVILTDSKAVAQRIAIAAGITPTSTAVADQMVTALVERGLRVAPVQIDVTPPVTPVTPTTPVTPATPVTPVTPATPSTGAPGAIGTLVQLDSRGAAGPYSWTLVSQPRGSRALLSSTSSATPSFTPDAVGLYVARLITPNGATSFTVPIGLSSALPAQARATSTSRTGSVLFSAHQSFSQLTSLETTMIVPAKPPASGTLFLWPGVQPQPGSPTYLPVSNGVLQPVLTWGNSCAPGVQPARYDSWWISAQYVNVVGQFPGLTGCHGGATMRVNVGDHLKLNMWLEGRVWQQSVFDLESGQSVSFAIDMQGQAQALGFFEVEGYGQLPVGDVVFTDAVLGFSMRDPQACYATRRGVRDVVAAPTTSEDGTRCYIPSVVLKL